mmetsp:Transcript_81400/g.256695  ORF Transcript_81400/g.256695 Transcript_81400/m.256695 type:complete len:654 (+) Transcript_81400:197-2158(+)
MSARMCARMHVCVQAVHAVADRQSQPSNVAACLHARVNEAARRWGLLCQPATSGARADLADCGIERGQGAELLLLRPEPLLGALGGEHHGRKDETHEDAEDDHTLEGERILGLVPEPRPLEHLRILGEPHLVLALLLRRLAEHAHAAPVDRHGPVLHLSVHEGARRQLHPRHELVEVERRPQVEGHHVVVARARVTVPHCHSAERIGGRLSRVARAGADADGEVRLLEGDVDGAHLLPLLLREDVRGRPGRNAVLRHVGGKRLPHRPGDVHDACGGLLDEVGEVLAVVAVEAHALEPAVEDGGLVLPVGRQGRPVEHDLREHHVAHIVPDPRVDKFHPPLVGEVRADLVPNLLAALVDQVGQVLPRDLVGVDVEDAPRGGHVPGRGVARAHVQDHVHVLEREGAAGVQKLVVAVRACEEGVVLQEVHLRALREVVRLPLRQQPHAQVVVDAEAVAALGGPDVEVLVVPVRHDHLVARRLVDLRGRNGVVRVRLQRAVHLAGKVALHGVGVVVHQHGVLRREQRLHLEEAGDRGVARAHGDLREVGEQPAARLARGHVPAPADGGVGVEDAHARGEHLGQVGQQLLRLRAGVLHRHHEAHRLDELGVGAPVVGERHRLWDAWEGGVAEEPPHAGRVEDAPGHEGEDESGEGAGP